MPKRYGPGRGDDAAVTGLDLPERSGRRAGVPMTYTYNLSGAMVEQKYPSGRAVRNVLDNDGDLAIVQSKENQNSGYWDYADSFTYTAAGAVSSIQLGNGKWESTQFNSRLQPIQIGLGPVQSGTDKLKLNFSYGTTANNGNVLSQTITVPSEIRNNVTCNAFTAVQNYSYDSLNRLKSAVENQNTTQIWKQTFTFDRYGNRNFDTANTTTIPTGCAVAVCNPQVDPATNKLVGYQFDSAGNTKVDATNRQFIYDGENKQTEVKGQYGTSIGKYVFDGDGKRVKKISATETTVFVYNASGQLVAEYSTQISQTPQVSYLTSTDHLGSPRAITNENGAVTTRQDFSAFGDETLTVQRVGYKPDSIRQDYTGYQKDDESGGLEFAQARYYNTKHGRFTSTDPLIASASVKDPQTFNRYSYAMNSPYKFTDPLGLISEKTDACGGRCANSGPSVDGSAFRGSDASFDWANSIGEPYAGGVQIAAGLTKDQVNQLVDAFSYLYGTETGNLFFKLFEMVEMNMTLILNVGDLSSRDGTTGTTLGLTDATKGSDGHITISITLDVKRIDKAVQAEQGEIEKNKERVFGTVVTTGVKNRQSAAKHEVGHGLHAQSDFEDYVKSVKEGKAEERVTEFEALKGFGIELPALKGKKASDEFKKLIKYDSYIEALKKKK